ncbi:MAG: glycosyltransferase, partial [Planctomycetota bacterium]
VCIPARDEEANIEAIVRSLLAQDHPAIRVVVYDDQSSDSTGEIVARLAAEDPRVLPCPTVPLTGDWNGKQHACWRMARACLDGLGVEPPAEDHELFVFTDADVRFEPDAIRRAAAERARADVALLSTFPRQITGSLPERLMVPMMFYLLLGYLPIARMRASSDPATSAGCGQFILMTAGAYRTTGGHTACKDSMHEGIKLPRAVRAAGLRSDLFDGTDLMSVRMYRGLGETWRGFAKNAYEGLGSPALLVFITVLHLVGHLLPWVGLVLWGLGEVGPLAGVLFAGAAALAVAQRLLLATRMRHSVLGALLHPLGVALMTGVQWWSLALHLRGRRAWRGRVLGEAGGA